MNIANKLTFSRMLMIPLFMVLMSMESMFPVIAINGSNIPLNYVLAGVVFIIASITDYLDGYYARKYQLVTNFGIFFDPMADKLLVMSALLYLQNLAYISVAAVFIILARELLVTGLRLLIIQEGGVILPAALPGKIKTFSQMLAIILFLFNDFGLTGNRLILANSCFYICVFFTIYSGIDYFWKSRHLLSK